MYKLGTKEGLLNSFYARNQFEPLPDNHLRIDQVDITKERPLRSVAGEQAVGGGQGFARCGCIQWCEKNNCKCFKAKVLCNSRCHNRGVNSKCLNHN